MKIYYELQSVNDVVSEYNGNSVNLTAEDYAAAHDTIEIDNDNNEPETYPDLVINGWDDTSPLPWATIEGVPQQAQQIIGGGHPPQRPK